MLTSVALEMYYCVIRMFLITIDNCYYHMHTYTHNTLTKTDEVYRVRLMCEGTSGADYINASFVNVSGHTQKLCKCLLLTVCIMLQFCLHGTIHLYAQ